MDPPAIIQPRVRRTQYSTKASWLNPMPPMICIASFETSHPARLQASFAMAVLCAEGNPCSPRSEEHTSELQSLMRISYAVFCLKKNNQRHQSKIVQP